MLRDSESVEGGRCNVKSPSQVGNWYFHMRLASLRKFPGDRVRYPLPAGGVFNYVYCPHYTCEALSWVTFNLLVPTRAGAWIAGLAVDGLGSLKLNLLAVSLAVCE